MADDGLLVNFTVDDAPSTSKTIFKGGRWKDRVKATKSLRRSTQKHQSEDLTNGEIGIPSGTQTASTDDGFLPPAKRQKANSQANYKHQASNSKPEVISSLFTSNPVTKGATSSSKEGDACNILPSNAPLPEGASNFTALGVNAVLASHLSWSLHLRAPTAIQKAAISQLLKEDSDAFIQAETGSGKTLAYLLPIIQRLMSLETRSKETKFSRRSGLFAIILAPTRELAKQIDEALTSLLKRLPWLVHGTVCGGTTKNHEKARIRKGINVLVATPGRLVDHLENTAAFDVGRVRWLVLDEGDRLVELGFEEDIRKLIAALEKQNRGNGPTISAPETKVDGSAPSHEENPAVIDLPEKRTTVLCSATMKMDVQKLGDISLKNAVLIKADATSTDAAEGSPNDANAVGQNGVAHGDLTARPETSDRPFLAPTQLKQSYIVAPAKQRLVTLNALLKRTFVRKATVKKAIVFVSCADSVDFYFEVFTRSGKTAADFTLGPSTSAYDKGERHGKSLRGTPNGKSTIETAGEEPHQRSQNPIAVKRKPDLPTVAHSQSLSTPANPQIQLFKLHGSLPQQTRSATLNSFSRSPDSSILFCTDVASRGLDLPNIDLVIEYDPAFASDEHLHRIGRTARAGREGRAICFLMPGPEEGYVEVLKAGAGKGSVVGEIAEGVLRKGFEGSRRAAGEMPREWDERATDWQLDVERWVIDDGRAGEMARKAYVSHVRAYATHVAKERGFFDVKELHLGHLAKAFALREKPGSMGRGQVQKAGVRRKVFTGEKRRLDVGEKGSDDVAKSRDEDHENTRPDWRGESAVSVPEGRDAARKMRAKMKEHMAIAGEFNIG